MTANPLPLNSSAIEIPLLDSSFAAIDWRAPWLFHISQLEFLSQKVEALSRENHQEKNLDVVNIDSKGDSKRCLKSDSNHSTTVIAELLNTAMIQQNNDFQKQPPQTKPTQSNEPHDLQFVSQDALPEGEAYESFIATTGNIPTRDNLHDLFNGSIWLTFPKTKALLNYYHMGEIALQGIGGSRGRVRDTITVFDENGAILVTAEPSIGEALIDFNWQDSLVSPRDKWDYPNQPQKPNQPIQPSAETQAAVYIFGHALLEQLIEPRKSLCAHSVVIHVEPDFFALSLPERIACLDNKLAEQMHALLSLPEVTPRMLAPLPILGVPHFWAENDSLEFYDDKRVFRSGRRRKA
jgi:hypothetical protein